MCTEINLVEKSFTSVWILNLSGFIGRDKVTQSNGVSSSWVTTKPRTGYHPVALPLPPEIVFLHDSRWPSTKTSVGSRSIRPRERSLGSAEPGLRPWKEVYRFPVPKQEGWSNEMISQSDPYWLVPTHPPFYLLLVLTTPRTFGHPHIDDPGNSIYRNLYLPLWL